ncbi:molybdate ABC transporter substrate-binding protein [Zeimonas arvi]|uniref:Molybdate ABC transporter substrate-binding protein n=1 Tax=Zeimonas arvi TaxID=2498847 RepID=A0A5C8P0D3_9BURK|nr:molybdate ABC transporter substrate-binding protein [Zeimonas arvi]TXL67045.1 molybdate ABC transporter substrate-binding protein [Zeimonas arvi]
MPRASSRRRLLRGTAGLAAAGLLAGGTSIIAAQSVRPAAAASSGSGDIPTVAAASDLKFALEELAARFTGETGRKLRLSFGSSGNFARQIEQGAPYQLFLSADEDMVFRLADKGLTVDRGTLYAVGRIVLIVPRGSPLETDGELRDLAAALADGRLKRLAIANPDHAPYGKRAEEALRHAGLWDAIRPRLVLGENVSQAAQFATSGSTQGGIVAQSLALSPQVARNASFALIPAAWHQPLRQRMVLIAGAGETARAFHAWLQQPAAREVLARYGFSEDKEEGGREKGAGSSRWTGTR